MINWDGLLSLLLACLEFILLINLLIFARKNGDNVMAFVLIALLTVYQSLEFMICTLRLRYSFMAYLAFADISFLPPLNFYFIFHYSGYRNKLLKMIFLPAIVFVVYYFLVIDKFAVTACSVLDASYNYPLGGWYAFFYYAPIAASIISIVIEINGQTDAVRVKLLKTLLSGLLFTSLPVIAAFALWASGSGQLLGIIESITCKFAFVYAICLAYFALVNNK